MENDRFTNRFPRTTCSRSIDIHCPSSIDYLPHPAKRPRPSIDIASITSIDIKSADLRKNIGISPIRATDRYIMLSTPTTKFQTATHIPCSLQQLKTSTWRPATTKAIDLTMQSNDHHRSPSLLHHQSIL